MKINSNENYYIARCNNKINSTCKFTEEYFENWNGKCCYGKDGNIYCTANWELKINDEEIKGCLK